MRQHPRIDRGHARHVSRRVTAQCLDRGPWSEAVEEDHARSCEQGDDELIVDAVRVVERHDVEEPVLRARAGVAQDAVGVADQAAVAQEHTFRAAGAARGEQQHRAVLAPESAVDEGAATVKGMQFAQRQTAQLLSMEAIDQALVDDEVAHADDVRLLGNRPGREARIDEADAGPRLHRAEVGSDRRGGFRRDDSHLFPAHDTPVADARGIAADEAPEFRIGHRLRARKSPSGRPPRGVRSPHAGVR